MRNRQLDVSAARALAQEAFSMKCQEATTLKMYVTDFIYLFLQRK